ncbi:hypothetical protein [Paraglaciecola sp.]|uniref:hypothetical protein n=1 Tax=Paraglaciecola sp. TaxID=1920173 RepID=UPI003EF9CCA0
MIKVIQCLFKKARLVLSVLLFISVNAFSADSILSATLEKSEIGVKEKPVVSLNLEVSKTRELFVAIQDTKSWRRVKQSMFRIKKSGKYHLAIDVDNLQPGQYRVDAYLTPKGKTWVERFAEPIFNDLTVVDKVKTAAPSNLAKTDQVLKSTWPMWIDDDQDTLLKIRFDISEPRDLHIKLLNTQTRKELGALKLPVDKLEDVIIPFSDMQSNFEYGSYVWISYLTERNSLQGVSEKKAKYFNILPPSSNKL